jgi:hypothetical protein
MKKLILFFAMAMAFSSCKKNDDTATPATDITAQVTASTWKVTLFTDSKQRDRTDKYAGYSFEFSSNGALKIKSASGTITGTWTTVVEKEKDKLTLTFATAVAEEILDLNDNWYVMDKTDKTLKLQKINGTYWVGVVQKEMYFTKI